MRLINQMDRDEKGWLLWQFASEDGLYRADLAWDDESKERLKITVRDDRREVFMTVGTVEKVCGKPVLSPEEQEAYDAYDRGERYDGTEHDGDHDLVDRMRSRIYEIEEQMCDYEGRADELIAALDQRNWRLIVEALSSIPGFTVYMGV